MGRPRTDTKLESEIAALYELSRPVLVARWKKLCRADPPKGLSQRLLVRGIAYEMQAKRYGGLKPATARRLRMIADGTGYGDRVSRATAPALKPGARLLREWNGVTHLVEVIEAGFVWNGDNGSGYEIHMGETIRLGGRPLFNIISYSLVG